jgi:hypothetical protein
MVGDAFVVTTVAGTGVVDFFAGAVVNAGAGVCVVLWVVRGVRESLLSGAGVAFDD